MHRRRSPRSKCVAGTSLHPHNFSRQSLGAITRERFGVECNSTALHAFFFCIIIFGEGEGKRERGTQWAEILFTFFFCACVCVIAFRLFFFFYFGFNHGAIFELHPNRTIPLSHNLRYSNIGIDFGTSFGGGFGYALGDRPHATFNVRPNAFLFFVFWFWFLFSPQVGGSKEYPYGISSKNLITPRLPPPSKTILNPRFCFSSFPWPSGGLLPRGGLLILHPWTKERKFNNLI